METSIKKLESRLAEVMKEYDGTMTVPTVNDLATLAEFEEESERLGVRFFRVFAGAYTVDEANTMSQEDVESYLKALAYPLAKMVCTRKGLANEPIPNNLKRHLANSFRVLSPKHKGGIGSSMSKSKTATPGKAFQGENCNSRTVSVALDNGDVWSFCLSWRWASFPEIMDKTVVTELAIGDGSVVPPIVGVDVTSETEEPVVHATDPRNVGFTPRDSGLTPQAAEDLRQAAYRHGWMDAINRQSPLFAPIIAEVSHKGLTINEIDKKIAAFLPYVDDKAITRKPINRKSRKIA
jgi:hypothetical protein